MEFHFLFSFYQVCPFYIPVSKYLNFMKSYPVSINSHLISSISRFHFAFQAVYFGLSFDLFFVLTLRFPVAAKTVGFTT